MNVSGTVQQYCTREAALVQLVSAHSESRWYFIAGIFAECALAIRPTNLELIPALVLWVRSARLKRYVSVFAAPVPGSASVTTYNYDVFHRVTASQLPRRAAIRHTPRLVFQLRLSESLFREAHQRVAASKPIIGLKIPSHLNSDSHSTVPI